MCVWWWWWWHSQLFPVNLNQTSSFFHLHWSIFRIDLLEWFTKESYLFNCNKSFFAPPSLFPFALSFCVFSIVQPSSAFWAFPFNSSKRSESVHSKLPFSTIEIFNVHGIKWMKLMDWKEVFSSKKTHTSLTFYTRYSRAHTHAHAHIHYVWFHDTKSALKIAYTRWETIKATGTHTHIGNVNVKSVSFSMSCNSLENIPECVEEDVQCAFSHVNREEATDIENHSARFIPIHSQLIVYTHTHAHKKMEYTLLKVHFGFADWTSQSL